MITRCAVLLVELQRRVDVPEKNPLRVPEVLRDMGLEIGEDAEAGFERLARIEVEVVDARPAEALALGLRQPAQVELAVGIQPVSPARGQHPVGAHHFARGEFVRRQQFEDAAANRIAEHIERMHGSDLIRCDLYKWYLQ